MEIHLLKDMAIVMAVAGAMTLLCHWLKQPVVIGYLLAGLLVGPYTPPFSLVSSLHSIHTLAELGLVFLLFSLGLEFNIPKIRKVGLSAGLAAVLEVVGMIVIGYALGRIFGWNKMDSMFLGAILSISSTTIIAKVFMDFKMMQEKFVMVVFGILVLEDIVAIIILSILSGLGTQGGPDVAIVVGSFVRVGLFVTLFLTLGLLLVPRFMHWVASFKSKEVLGIVTLGFCLSGAMLASVLELSVALGAFLMGAVLAASKEIHEIEEWINPVRDMFSAIFFVSAGMLIQPQLLWDYKGPIIIVTLVTIVGKVLSGGIGSFLAGYDLKTSARVGMSVAQIGEFSFVIASLGLTLKVTSDFLYPLAIMVSSLTTLATPYLIHNSDALVERGLGLMPARFKHKLDQYHDWVEQRSAKPKSATRTVLSKYVVRFGVYLSFFVVIIIALNALSQRIFSATTVTTLWGMMAFVCLPLFTALSKYVSHVILLLVVRNRALLNMIDVHKFYKGMDAVMLSVWELIFIFSASFHISDLRVMSILVFALLMGSYLFRDKIVVGRNQLEKWLDDVTGVALSDIQPF